MATTISVSLIITFEDLSEKSFSVDGVPSASANPITIRNKINAINNDPVVYAPFRSLFLSNEGSPFSSISGARITSVDEEVIYNG